MEAVNRNKFSLYLVIGILAFSCKKAKTVAPPDEPPGDTTVIIPPAVDPPLANTIGFFLDDWQEKTFTVPSSFSTGTTPSYGNVIVKVDHNNIITKISPALFGNNANTYMSQMVDQPVLINHLKNLAPGLLRFPGGNLSSVFFWNAAPGEAPADAPEKLIDGGSGNEMDAGYWFGKNSDYWTLSTDNYYAMLQQTGSEGVITINYGYARYGTGDDPVAAAAHLAAEWVRYDNGRTRYWEIGNESNGTWQAGNRIDISNNKDGQPEIITGALYGAHFKVFADSMRKAAQETGATIYIGAQLLEQAPASWATNTDKSWNQGVLSASANSADYYIVHSYYTPYNTNSNAAEILATPATVTAHMMDYLKQNIPANGAVQKPIALTEYNIFATGSQQMVSHINGMHAVMVVGELMKNKFGMACRWDLANAWENGNDHGMFSQGEAASGESKWTPRPSFYHLYFFQKMLGDRAVGSSVTNGNGVYSYASTFSSGEVAVAIANTTATAHTARIEFDNFLPGSRYYWYTLTGGGDNGEFSRKTIVNGQGPTGVAGGPQDYASITPYAASVGSQVKFNLPARSVVFVVVEKKK
ncbi:MAG: alpha-L-arabinofuranosidase [Chitinophagaceae bacterium]|nr:alpha-L-arabinofuranosidase [Chitinophagaceae bacterium]MCW5928392.1 alpha-L-arabinofuranosidase [Chitinophagaceae bacterium]